MGDITDDNGAAVILFVQEETPDEIMGHWLGVAPQGATGTLMFDPYGGTKADPWYRNSKEFTAQELDELDQEGPVLAAIIRDAGRTPLFNRIAYQADRKDINTCGRHCVVRIWNAHLSNEEYNHALYSHGENADTTVTRLTDDFLSGASRNKLLAPMDT